MNWYLKVWKQYADFSGRARRTEFWLFNLINSLIFFLLSLILIPLGAFSMISSIGYRTGAGSFIPIIIVVILLLGFLLAIIIPSLAVCVRRLHDVGKSGWFILIGWIPVIGQIVLLILCIIDSQTGENKWGVNPKESPTGSFGKRDKPKSRDFQETLPHIANKHNARLLCQVGSNTYTYHINDLRTTIGRDNANDLVINHLTVSRHHAEIVSSSAGFEIIDKGSTNKVIVNGQFFQRKVLRDGDIIGLGEVVLTFVQ